VAVVEQSETMMVLSSDVQLNPEERLGLGAQQDVQIVTPIVEQILINPVRIKETLGDKVQVGPELIRSNQAVNPMRGLWRRGSEMEMKSSLFKCVLMRAHETWWLFSDLDVFESR